MSQRSHLRQTVETTRLTNRRLAAEATNTPFAKPQGRATHATHATHATRATRATQTRPTLKNLNWTKH